MRYTLIILVFVNQTAVAQEVLPRYEQSDCVFEPGRWADNVNLECGTLFVPEDPGQSQGRILRLPVAVLRAQQPASKPPLVLLHGGPGGSPDQLVSMTQGVVLFGLSRDRDVVLFDQRGAGQAQPVLCPDFRSEFYQRGDEEARERFRAQARACVERIRREGGDPAMYNTRNSAGDLKALRLALDYAVWDVYGESYGGRLAAEAMRADPGGIRSVVLSRPAPQGPFRAEMAKIWWEALSRIFEECAADRSCAAAFPTPEEDLHVLFERLEASTIVFDSLAVGAAIRLDGSALVHALARLANAPSGIARIPFLLNQMRRGDVDRASRELMTLTAGRNPDRVSFWLVECFDQYGPQFETLQDSLEATVPALFRVHRPLECDLWQDKFALEEERRPVSSSIPTLILTGQFDPTTPSSFGHRIAASLSTAYVVELPSESHSVQEITACHGTIVSEFWEDPTTEPDTSCIATVPPEFVTSWPREGGGM